MGERGAAGAGVVVLYSRVGAIARVVFAVFAMLVLVWALFKVKSNILRGCFLVLLAIPVVILVLVYVYAND